MATITYKCSKCDRTIDLVENKRGITTFSKCVITFGCNGKLLTQKRNQDNIRESFPAEVPGLEDYSQRRILFDYKQTIPNTVWPITHDLNTVPTVSVYTTNASGIYTEMDEGQYTITPLGTNKLKLTFKNAYAGRAQLVSRNSIKMTPSTVAPIKAPAQATSNGYFVFAIPKYLTKFEYPPSLLPTPQLPYELNSIPVRIEVNIKKPNEEEEICTEAFVNSVSSTPWGGWNEILIRKRRNYYLFSKSILDFRTFGGDTLKFSDIPDGTQLKITRIDYGTGVLQPIPQEGLYILLANTPYTTNDKVKDKVIDVAKMVENDIDYFSYTTSDFFVDQSNVEKTYPEILQVKAVNFVPPTPSPTPTISPTTSLTPSVSLTKSVVVSPTPTPTTQVSTTAMATPTPTASVTKSSTPTPTVTPTPTPGSFNQPFDFALIRYTWTPNDGTDLDTRTAIVVPARNIDVGWSRGDTDSTFLTWGGDNTSPNGPEAVLVDFNSLSASYNSIVEFTIRLRLNWYGNRVDGNVGVQFQSFLGGTMQHTGTDFVNVGGQLVNDATIYVNAVSNTAGNVDGSDIGSLIYNANDKTARFVPLVPAITPTPTPTLSLTVTSTPLPSATISVTPSVTPTISNTASVTPTVSVTTSPINPNITPTPTASSTPSLTASTTPTISLTPTITPSASSTLSTYSRLVLQGSPVAYYMLNETPSATTIFKDSSGNGYDASKTSGGFLNAVSAPSIVTGNTSSVQSTSLTTISYPLTYQTLLSGPFTYEAWVLPTSSSGHQTIMAHGNPTNSTAPVYLKTSNAGDGKAALAIYDTTSVINMVYGPVLSMSTPSHLVGVYDGTNMILYVNGQESGRALTQAPATSTNPNTIDLFNSYTSGGHTDAYIGSMSDVAVYDYALSAATILAHYQNGSSIQPTPTPTPSNT